MINSNILIIDDDPAIIRIFSAYLSNQGYNIYRAEDYAEALNILFDNNIDVVFSDIILGEHSGIDILKEVKLRGLECPVIMITGDPGVETASASLRLGAFDYISKPINKDTFIQITKHAIQHKAFIDERALIERERESYRVHLEAILNSVDDAIVTVGNNLEVSQVNSAFENICKTNTIIGSTVPNIINRCSLKCWKVFEDVLRTNNFIRDFRIVCEHAKNPGQIVMLNINPLKDNSENQIGGVMVIKDITRLSHLEEELQERSQYQNILGKNKKMQEIYSLIDNLKEVDTTVLITGPSGTGKDIIARAIHYSGVRSHKPFVAVNCSALSEGLLESELFGHVKGAFTGAVKDKAGRFHLADNGTIFLDEIGDISPQIQVKLLRVIENREFERVGDPTPVKMDVRIITATNQDLLKKVKKGLFREDLYYRLKVVEINVPALKDRRDDISLILDHYLCVYNRKFNKNIMNVSRDVGKLFLEYDWPGNVRELMHVLEHAYVMCQDSTIQINDLPSEMRDHHESARSHYTRRSTSVTREEILYALRKTGWNKVQSALILGVSRPNLYQKMRDYNISILEE